MDLTNSTSASEISGSLKRRTVCTDEVHSSAKRTRLETYSGGSGLSSDDDEEDPLQKPSNPVRPEKVPCLESSRNDCSGIIIISDEEDEEDRKQSFKKIPKTIAPGIKKDHNDEVRLNFMQGSKVNASSSSDSIKHCPVESRNTLEGKIKDSFESSIELLASKEDISKNSQEFLHLLLKDIEEQENDQSKKTREFLSFTHHRTPQKTDGQDNLISSLAIYAPKKKLDAINSKNRNQFASLSSDQLGKKKLEDEYNQTSEVTNSLSNMTIHSLTKKAESSKRKLNFQDLCLSDVNDELLKCLPNESCDREESDSNDSDLTFVDAYEPQVVSESLKSKCPLHLEQNQDKKNESDNKADSKDSIEGGGIKPNKPFPFIFSQRYKAGRLKEASGEQKSNIQGCKANLIEGESNNNTVASTQIGQATLKTPEVTNSLSNKTIKSDSSKHKLNFQGLGDVNVELLKCLPIELCNREESDSNDSDVTFVDAYEPQVVSESLKAKRSLRLEENQDNESNSNKPFRFISSQQYKTDSIRQASEEEQQSKSYIQASLIKGESLDKIKIISEFIFKTSNNAMEAESSHLSFQDLCVSDKNLGKSKNLSGMARDSPIEPNNEEANDSDDSDVTLLDLKTRLDSKRRNLKSRDFSSLEENQKHSVPIDVKARKSFPFVFSQPQCKAERLRMGRIHRERNLRRNSESKSLRNNSEKIKERGFIFLEGNPNKQSISGNTSSEGKRLELNKARSKDSIFLKDNPNKERIFQNANSSRTNDAKNGLEAFFFSQPQCKADESRLNHKENRIRDGLWKSSDELNWIEQKSQELMLDKFSQPSLPIREKSKTTKAASDFTNYKNSFEDGSKSTFHASKLEGKLKTCDDLKLTRSFLAVEDRCEQNQGDEGKKRQAGAKFDCSGLLTPFEIQEENDFNDELFKSDCGFCVEAAEEICVKNRKAFLRHFSQPQGRVGRFGMQKKHCGEQKLDLPPNFLEFPRKHTSQPLPKVAETKRDEHIFERNASNCQSKILNRLPFENKTTINEEMSPKNFKGFAKGTSTLVNGEQVLETNLIDGSGQKASTLENKSPVNDEDARDVHENRPQQNSINLDDGSNSESINFIFKEDTESYGENADRFLKDIDNALAKIKKTLATESEQPEEKENSSRHLLSEHLNEEENEDDFASNSHDANQITFQDLCVPKMKDGKHYSTLQNKESLFVNASEFEDFTERHLEILSNQMLAHAELSQQSNVSFDAHRSSTLVRSDRDEVNLSQKSSRRVVEGTDFTRTFINRSRSNGALSTGSKENFTLPEKRLRQGLNHVIRDKSLLCHEKDASSSEPSQTTRLRVIEKLSEVFMRLRDDVNQKKSPILEIRNQNDWDNCLFINNRVILKPLGEAKTTIINFHRKKSKLHFNLIIFLLGKVINMLSEDSSCTKRELYYQLIKFVKSETQVSNAVDHISCLLDEPPWQLGFTAMSKGLIYGDLKIVACDHVINCNVPGGSLVPGDVQKITQLISDAYFILIVEKDAIFQKLLQDDLPNKLTRPFVMITGKGYPDVNLRFFIKKLTMVMSVPVFILVDADPYGIDIMLTYRFGSLRMAHLNEYLAVPNARWIGVYPSEIIELNVSHQPLNKKDESKIRNILKRPYCASFAKLKDEMEILLRNNFKAEIEGLLKSDTFLRDFYLPNKFLTQDYI